MQLFLNNIQPSLTSLGVFVSIVPILYHIRALAFSAGAQRIAYSERWYIVFGSDAVDLLKKFCVCWRLLFYWGRGGGSIR